jgi:hypothetical protein
VLCAWQLPSGRCKCGGDRETGRADHQHVAIAPGSEIRKRASHFIATNDRIEDIGDHQRSWFRGIAEDEIFEGPKPDFALPFDVRKNSEAHDHEVLPRSVGFESNGEPHMVFQEGHIDLCDAIQGSREAGEGAT